MLIKALKSILLTIIILLSIKGIFPNWKEDYSNFRFALNYKSFFSSKPKILVVWGNGYGEQGQIKRIAIGAEHLGINLKTVSNRYGNDPYDTHVYKKLDAAARIMQPDIILTIERNIPPIPGYRNYLVLDQSSSNYLLQDINNNYNFVNNSYLEFDGLLPTFSDTDGLRQALEKNDKKLYGLPWYPTVFSTNYVALAPKRLFHPGGSRTDPTRSSIKYNQLFKMLDKTGYLEVHGNPDRWWHTPKSFKGFIPNDPIVMLDANNAAGVTLILHAEDHLVNGIPTGRIFEAAAANTVIISDDNAFIRKYFADNVLYIDMQQDAPVIFRQINKHMKWILENPAAAQRKAENCHAIFLEKFTMEQQLQKVLIMGGVNQ